MIDWMYSDSPQAVIWTGETRGEQKVLEVSKTILDYSNRSRVVTDVVYDDFMQLERPLGVERVPSRLAATRRASRSSNTGIQQRDLSPVTKSQNPMVKSPSRKICS